jgi:hypothetical protein
MAEIETNYQLERPTMTPEQLAAAERVRRVKNGEVRQVVYGTTTKFSNLLLQQDIELLADAYLAHLDASRDDGREKRILELERAIGSATQTCLRVLLTLLPTDADVDREFTEKVLARLEAAMTHDKTIWLNDEHSSYGKPINLAGA